jgi:hypothetical protein
MSDDDDEAGSAGSAAEELDAHHRSLPAESAVSSEHVVTIGGVPVPYCATAGTQPVWDADGKVIASLFYTFYERTDVADKASRPLCISFNGGPGSASVWMHIAYTGPVQLNIDSEGHPLQPYGVKANPHSILDVADVSSARCSLPAAHCPPRTLLSSAACRLLVTPLCCGKDRVHRPCEHRVLPHPEQGHRPRDLLWCQRRHKVSRAVVSLYKPPPPRSCSRYWELSQLRCPSRLDTFVSRSERWTSPKYLIGESYGTTRVSGLALELQNAHYMYLNGVVLVSPTEIGIKREGPVADALTLPVSSS